MGSESSVYSLVVLMLAGWQRNVITATDGWMHAIIIIICARMCQQRRLWKPNKRAAAAAECVLCICHRPCDVIPSLPHTRYCTWFCCINNWIKSTRFTYTKRQLLICLCSTYDIQGKYRITFCLTLKRFDWSVRLQFHNKIILWIRKPLFVIYTPVFSRVLRVQRCTCPCTSVGELSTTSRLHTLQFSICKLSFILVCNHCNSI